MWHLACDALPKGLHILIGVDRDQPMPACSVQGIRMTADLQLFVYAQDAAMCMFLPTRCASKHQAVLKALLELIR